MLRRVSRTLARATRWSLVLIAAMLVGCHDTQSAPEPDASPRTVADVASVPPTTIEVFSPGTFRHDGRIVDLEALARAFMDADRGRTEPIVEPLVIIAPASLEIRDTMPAILVAMQPPGHAHLTLRVVEKGVSRETTIPVLTTCLCRAIHFRDGDAEPFGHDGSRTYVIVTARIADDGTIRTHEIDFDDPQQTMLPGELPPHLPTGAPEREKTLDLGALRTWFEALREDGMQPLLCLDYRDSLRTGHLVDALTVARNVLGHRVLLGPNPREPELEDEPVDEFVDED